MRVALGWAGMLFGAGSALAGCSGDDTVGFAADAAGPRPAPTLDASFDATVTEDASLEDAPIVEAAADAPLDASVPLRAAVALASTATSVAGSTSFCALLADGSVRCWGNDGYGQSGTGAPASPFMTTLPVTPVGLSFGVAIVAVGDTFAGAVQQGSTLLWGDDALGELGNGTVAPSYTPRVVMGLGAATALSLGGQAGCAIVASGIQCWGANTFGNVGSGTTVVQPTPMAIGVDGLKVAVSEHACAVIPGGGITCWGRNDFGQLGRVGAGTCTSASIPCDPTPAPSSITKGASELAVGADFTCAIAPSGARDAGPAAVAQCWGDDRQGQLGGGTSDTAVHVSPVLVTGLSATPTKLAAGGAFACALGSGGAVQCWGANDKGQLGGTPSGTAPVTALTGATAIAAGSTTACAIVAGGLVECWGANDQGQLGIGSSDATAHPPTVVLAR